MDDNAYEELSFHVLQRNESKHSAATRPRRGQCHFCSVLGVSAKNPITTWGCVDCALPFHPECFSISHNIDRCITHNPDLQWVADGLEDYHLQKKNEVEYICTEAKLKRRITNVPKDEEDNNCEVE